MNTNNITGSHIANAFAVLTTAIQPNEILQWVSFVATLIATIVSLAFTIYKWYKASKEDGKITKDEIKEGIDIVVGGVAQITEQVKDMEKKQDDKN